MKAVYPSMRNGHLASLGVSVETSFSQLLHPSGGVLEECAWSAILCCTVSSARSKIELMLGHDRSMQG